MRGGGFDLIGRSLQQNGDGRHKKIKRPVEGEGKAATAMHKHTYCLNKEARDFLLGLFLVLPPGSYDIASSFTGGP
jgi:hypothetical protein